MPRMVRVAIRSSESPPSALSKIFQFDSESIDFEDLIREMANRLGLLPPISDTTNNEYNYYYPSQLFRLELLREGKKNAVIDSAIHINQDDDLVLRSLGVDRFIKEDEQDNTVAVRKRDGNRYTNAPSPRPTAELSSNAAAVTDRLKNLAAVTRNRRGKNLHLSTSPPTNITTSSTGTIRMKQEPLVIFLSSDDDDSDDGTRVVAASKKKSLAAKSRATATTTCTNNKRNGSETQPVAGKRSAAVMRSAALQKMRRTMKPPCLQKCVPCETTNSSRASAIFNSRNGLEKQPAGTRSTAVSRSASPPKKKKPCMLQEGVPGETTTTTTATTPASMAIRTSKAATATVSPSMSNDTFDDGDSRNRGCGGRTSSSNISNDPTGTTSLGGGGGAGKRFEVGDLGFVIFKDGQEYPVEVLKVNEHDKTCLIRYLKYHRAKSSTVSFDDILEWSDNRAAVFEAKYQATRAQRSAERQQQREAEAKRKRRKAARRHAKKKLEMEKLAHEQEQLYGPATSREGMLTTCLKRLVQLEEGEVLYESHRTCSAFERYIYFAVDNETPADIADKFGLPVGKVMYDNKRDVLEHDLKVSSRLNPCTMIVIPVHFQGTRVKPPKPVSSSAS